MVLPNQKLAQDKIINYSRSAHRRADLSLGVSYDSDVQKAIAIMKEEPLKVEGVQTEKGVSVFLDAFGDYSINFMARYWIDTTARGMLDVKTEVANNVKDRFAEEGIDIPYPTRVTLSKSLD